MLERLKRVSKVVFFAHVAGGFVLIASLVFFADPFVIGAGRFEHWIQRVEAYDFSWWIIAVVVCIWLLPILLVVIYQSAKAAGLEARRVAETIRPLLENRVIPIQVDLDRKIPVKFDEPIHVPVKLDTKVDFEGAVEVETEIPIKTEIPIEADVQTKVLGFGLLKIPIRAQIPVDLLIPVKRTIHIKASGLPLALDEVAVVNLPALEFPLKARIETKIDVLSNLESAQDLLMS